MVKQMTLKVVFTTSYKIESGKVANMLVAQLASIQIYEDNYTMFGYFMSSYNRKQENTSKQD